MKQLFDLVNGKKTYLAAFGFLLLAFYEFSLGNSEKASEYFLLGLGVAGLRHAVEKKE